MYLLPGPRKSCRLMIRAQYTGRRRRAGREKAEALRARYGFDQSLLELIPEN